jgi:hypothetical protein
MNKYKYTNRGRILQTVKPLIVEGVGIMITEDTISPPNDRTLLRIEILQDEIDYLLASIEASPHNYFTNAPLHMSLRYLSQRIEELEIEAQEQANASDERDQQGRESQYDRISVGDHPVYTMKGH